MMCVGCGYTYFLHLRRRPTIGWNWKNSAIDISSIFSPLWVQNMYHRFHKLNFPFPNFSPICYLKIYAFMVLWPGTCTLNVKYTIFLCPEESYQRKHHSLREGLLALNNGYKWGVHKVRLPPVDIIQALESEAVCFFWRRGPNHKIIKMSIVSTLDKKIWI